jgi:hypothetical protein
MEDVFRRDLPVVVPALEKIVAAKKTVRSPKTVPPTEKAPRKPRAPRATAARPRKKAAAPVTPAEPTVTQEEIRVRAYFLSLEHGGNSNDVDFWLMAERELTQAKRDD